MRGGGLRGEWVAIPHGADAGREGDGGALAHRLVLGPAHLLLARGLPVGADGIAELERTASRPRARV